MLKVKVNFEIYIADRRATTSCIKVKLFLLRCVNPEALPLVRCYSIRLPWRVASWVNYSSRLTESSSEHFASVLSLLKADALWCENKRCSDSNPYDIWIRKRVCYPLHHSASCSLSQGQLSRHAASIAVNSTSARVCRTLSCIIHQSVIVLFPSRWQASGTVVHQLLRCRHRCHLQSVVSKLKYLRALIPRIKPINKTDHCFQLVTTRAHTQLHEEVIGVYTPAHAKSLVQMFGCSFMPALG